MLFRDRREATPPPGLHASGRLYSSPLNDLARIIDANHNRAREALRVMEDAARFALDDPELCALLKSLRHDLREAMDGLAAPGLDRGRLLASRDTPGDVGTAISNPAEGVRSGLPAIVNAAAARLTEALRSIEEAAKAVGDGSAFERLRYRAYDIERRLCLAIGAEGKGRPQWRLCVLISERLCRHGSWDEVARAAIRGGADCLQLREKELDSGELLRRARRLVDIAHEHEPRPAIVINDRPDIAVLARADGVHLGQSDLGITDARAIVGFSLLIGLSTADLEQGRAAVRQGADYCGLGPMFATATKHKPDLSGPAYLAAYLADDLCRSRPHLAIGGIGPGTAGELWRLGCRGIAVSSAVCAAPDPEAVCCALVADCPDV
jgi:thiamine-phosphate pyrophosphorylase